MINIVKIGGSVINDKDVFGKFLHKFASISGNKILIHGGGSLATDICRKLGIPQQIIDGRRITNQETLDVAVMTYAGIINKSIVAQLQVNGFNAIGLSGVDANCILAVIRPPKPINYGFVGDVVVDKININFIKTLIDHKIIPVFCSITHNEQGYLLNTNADSIASSIAIAMSRIDRVLLTFCFEKDGVLSDIDNENSIVSVLSKQLYTTLKEAGNIKGGMIPKIDNAFDALSAGVEEVRITNALNIDKDSGTKLVLD